MFTSKIAMEALPNVHLLGVLTVSYTVVFRWRALFPIYAYVMLNGLLAGFSPWWIPYLYIWTLLWGATMLLPKHLPKRVAAAVYPILTALHGIAFGILYAPAQAILFHLSAKEALAWIIAGLPFDLIHSVSNFALGLLVLPITRVLFELKRRMYA